MAGPLNGIKVLDFGGIGPCPYATMLLADLGAEVVRIDRPMPKGPAPIPPLATDVPPEGRGKKSVFLNLKSEEGIAAARALVEWADVLIEGFRPGAIERMGFGPEICTTWNPGLIFCRMTGWGQEGPLAQSAGHDLTYLALTGLLHAMGRAGETPHPPSNIMGDYAGGSLFAVIGILSALLERAGSGKGQVIDAAIIDGVSALTTPLRGFRAAGRETYAPGKNVLDCGFPFNSVYRCRDGRDVALAAIEEPFFQAFCAATGLDPARFEDRWNRARWADHRAALTALFATRTRDAWARLTKGAPNLCLAPVLDLDEATKHPHNTARAAFLADGQPAPAPRFSRTPTSTPGPAMSPGANTYSVLTRLGVQHLQEDTL